MADQGKKPAALTCWGCGAQIPLGRLMVLNGERIVRCEKCGRTNSLDRPSTGRI